jgi:hypothetical protein
MRRWQIHRRHPARDYYILLIEFAPDCWRCHDVSGLRLYTWRRYGLLEPRPC